MSIRFLLLITTVVSLLSYSTVPAVEFSAGPKIGLNLAKFYGAETYYYEDEEIDPYEYMVSKPGLLFGAALQMKVVSMFAIQPEILFSQKGFKLSDDDYSEVYKLNYLDVPVLFKLLIPAGNVVTPQIYTGPSFSFKLGKIDGTMKYEDEEEDMDDDEREEADKYLNTFDFGLAMGGGLGIKAGPGDLLLDVRFTLGLTNVDKLTDEMEESEATSDNLNKNKLWSFSVGYLFRF